ncbi:MAG TPA: hypothetical protein VF735_13420 [Pyrinomonadaceae bacterium]|jgi:hypothetical protein
MSKINIDRAQFSTVPSSGDPIRVHFNPSSLQLSVTNEMEPNNQQFVKKNTTKLTLDLILDTTDTGEDVRNTTKKVVGLMQPKEEKKKKVPPVVLFEWGNFKFQGLIESCKETIDFFSHDGVPLRASVNLSLSQQEKVFGDDKRADVTGGSLVGGGGNQPPPGPDAVDVRRGDGQSATDMATTGGDPDAGRDIAAANDEESIRFPSGQMTLDPSVQLGSPVAFASGASPGIGGGVSAGAAFSAGTRGSIGVGAGTGITARGGIGFSGGAAAGFSASAGARAGVGASFGASAGFSAGFKIGASAGFGASASAGAGGGMGARASFTASASAGALFGGSASAGVTASQGAFSGLRVQTRTRRFNLDTSRFIQRSESATVTTDSGARFSVGGRATFEASTSLSTDVGASASLRTRITFEEG